MGLITKILNNLRQRNIARKVTKSHLSLLYLVCMEKINVIYVRFDKQLDYKAVVNSFYIKKFLEGVYGEMPTMISPKKFEFSGDALAEFIQKEFDASKEYVVESKSFPTTIPYDEKLDLVEFEPEVLLDDHIVTVNSGDRVLGVFATELDFEHIIDEI